MKARKNAATVVGLIGLLLAVVAPAAARADFGLNDFKVEARNEDKTIDFQAGSHPYEYEVAFTMNQDGEEIPEGVLRDVIVELPPGLVGNPLAIPRCPTSAVSGQNALCPGDTQIGVADVSLVGFEHPLVIPVFNLTAPTGIAGRLGFSLTSLNTFEDASVRSDSDFGLNISDINVPAIPGTIEIQKFVETIWGVPADSIHDAERQCNANGKIIEGCESDVEPLPFLSLPTSCGAPLETTIKVDSVENPGVFDERTVLSEEEGTAAGMNGCNHVEFEPSIKAQPTTNLGDSPTGLDFDLHQPQNQDPEGLSTAHLKETTVTLPPGLVITPSGANGLDACSESQIGYQPKGEEIHFSNAPQSCPDGSKVGTLEVNSPLVDHKLPGAVYVARPFENPFGSLLAIYLAVEDPQTGVIAKLAGKVTPDPVTGQLTTTFKESPQLPLEDVELHFFGGARATLSTPLACGKYTTTSTLTPWSSPEGKDAGPTDSFQVSAPAGGNGSCPKTEAEAPIVSGFNAGTLTPTAGAYSPFVFRFNRPDGTQRGKQVALTLPPGMTGRIAGTSQCSEADIAAARAREAPGKGALEIAAPSCPANSHLGIATVGAGAGPTPYYVQGEAFLAGPYKGAPLSVVVITPAVAGPFDLGTVVVRTALSIDPVTAQILAVSDDLPTILDGIPVNVRSVALKLERPNFTLNPTSCNPFTVQGSAITSLGLTAQLSSPFQVGNCNALGFKPKVSLRFKSNRRRSHPKLIATVQERPGDANIAYAQVTLPRLAFLDQAHIRTVCTRVQFAANACPAASIYGRASATTPLLDQPLNGNVYLRSSSHTLPDLVVALKGPDSLPIEVELAGRTDSFKRALRNTFEAAPDAPVSSFRLELFGGHRGLIVLSKSLCAKEYRSTVRLKAHSGAEYDARPKVKAGCGGKGKKKQVHHKRHGR